MRIYELAKQLNAKSEVLVDLLLIAGFDIKGHMSRLDDEMLVEISEHFKLPPDLSKRAKAAKIAIAKKEAEEAKTAKAPKLVKAKAAPRIAAKVIRKARPVTPPEEEKKPEEIPKPVEEKKPAEEAQPAGETLAAAPPKKAIPKKAEPVGPGTAQPEVSAAAPHKPEPVSAVPEKKEPLKAQARPGVVGLQRPEAAAPPAGDAKVRVKPRAEAAAPAAPPLKPVEKPGRPPVPPKEAGAAEAPPKGPRKKGERQKVRILDQLIAEEEGEAVPGARKPKVAKRKDVVDVEAQQKAVRESVRRTLAKIETTRKTKRRKGKAQEGVASDKPVQVMEGVSVRELAAAFKVDPSEIIKKCFEMGLPATINQALDKDTIELLSEDLGKTVEFAEDEFGTLLTPEKEVDAGRLKPRPPIVTVMGHVDHGKTSILDVIRHTSVAAGEAGGITQAVGAYEVDTPGGKITFIDTPGHEAFTSMRARGAQVTDIVVLVVAADDGVMPQTIEAINHAKDARVPIIVAVNKVDLPTAKPLHVKKQLAEMGVMAEDYGGDVIMIDVSARTGEGINKLLEMILLQADVMELRADAETSGRGVAIEVRKEEGRGILCTILVTQGTLHVGDVFVIGQQYGKIRALLDHRGQTVKEAPPAMPVVVLGCNGLPVAGDRVTVVADEREARDLSMRRQIAAKERARRAAKKLTLEELYSQFAQGALKELRLVIKGDTNGSIEALSESLSRLSVEDIGVKIVHSGVGVVNESDVLLAGTTDGIIIAYNVKVAPKAIEVAENQGIEIRSYQIIYECISDVQKALQGMLEPEKVERVTGKAEVRQVFKISRLGLVAGCYVVEGSIARNALVRVFRDGELVYEGKISSLKRFQDDAREVQKDFECGIGVGGIADIREGDIIEAYVVEERAKVV